MRFRSTCELHRSQNLPGHVVHATLDCRVNMAKAIADIADTYIDVSSDGRTLIETEVYVYTPTTFKSIMTLVNLLNKMAVNHSPELQETVKQLANKIIDK